MKSLGSNIFEEDLFCSKQLHIMYNITTHIPGNEHNQRKKLV